MLACKPYIGAISTPMHRDLFFDLESNDTELEYNSDVSVDFLESEESGMSCGEAAELKAELLRLNKLKDM